MATRTGLRPGRLDRVRWPAGLPIAPIALAILLVVAAVVLYRATRGTTLWFDEWTWALERRAGGLVTPHTFTHGTSAQRVKWFKKGYQTGDISQGDTFAIVDDKDL